MIASSDRWTAKDLLNLPLFHAERALSEAVSQSPQSKGTQHSTHSTQSLQSSVPQHFDFYRDGDVKVYDGDGDSSSKYSSSSALAAACGEVYAGEEECGGDRGKSGVGLGLGLLLNRAMPDSVSDVTGRATTKPEDMSYPSFSELSVASTVFLSSTDGR